MISFTIFAEPASKANSRKIVTIGGRPSVIKSKKALQYERDAIRQIPASARQMLEGPVKVTITIYYASERPDLDESIVLDVMQAKFKRVPGKYVKGSDGTYTQPKGERFLIRSGVYLNDRQVREKHITHAIDRENPRAEIEVEALQPQQAAIPLPIANQARTAANPF